MLPLQIFGQRSAGFAIAPLGLMRSVNESIGDPTHCRHNNGYGMFSRSVRNDLRGTPDARGISDRGATKFHYL
jgi:hypothetical protein